MSDETQNPEPSDAQSADQPDVEAQANPSDSPEDVAEQTAESVDAESESTEQSEPEVLNNDEKVAAMEAEVAAMKDQMVRDQAETQNIRKRLQGEVDKARKFALEKFAEDLLAVMDNLERAIDTAADDEAVKPIVEGVELTRKSFVDILAKYQVEQIDPHGEPFDPQLHEAMTMVPNPDMEPNSVMDVFQKGYVLNGRLIRPARVVVSKAP